VSAPAAVGDRRSGLELARDRHQAAFQWIQVLSLAALAVVVTVSVRGQPAPGVHGAALAVTIALIAFCGASIGAIWLARNGSAAQLAMLLVAVAGAATLIGLQPSGAGFLGVFPAVSLAAMVLPARLSAIVAGVALAAVSAAWAGLRHTPTVGIILNDFGVLAFYLLSLLARRLRESNRQAELLLAELEQTRAAQAHAAALAERQRLAREMHDVLAHSLSGLVLNLEGARLLAGQGGGAGSQLADAIERAHRLARTGLEEARRAIGMLRDDALPGPERLGDLAGQFERDSGISCTVTVTGAQRPLTAEGRLTLYRVAQEALTNVRKHAEADRVDIRLGYEPAGTRLTIRDSGANGESVPRCEGTGYGLTGMRERAELLGGTLAAGPAGDGFGVELWVPA